MRKSTSSSDSSDDDDDDRTMKIKFTINNTITQKSPIVEENDEAKILNAMRLVDKNIGHFATYSRTAGRVSQAQCNRLANSSFLFSRKLFLGRGK